MNDWKTGEYPKRMLQSIKEMKARIKQAQQSEIVKAAPLCASCGSTSHTTKEHVANSYVNVLKSGKRPSILSISRVAATQEPAENPHDQPVLTHKRRRWLRKRFKKLPHRPGFPQGHKLDLKEVTNG